MAPSPTGRGRTSVRALALGALLLAGCAWTVRSQGLRYDNIDRPSTPSSTAIPILADTSAVGRPFVVIGLVRAGQGSLAGLGEGDLLAGLRREARKMGGDALIGLRREPAALRGAPTHIELKPIDPEGQRRDAITFDYVAEVISFDLLLLAPDPLTPADTTPAGP